MARITQQMLSRSTLSNLQRSLDRTERIQERLATGRALNRPSDSPTGLVTAMQTRSSLARVRTQLRAADNAQGWLDAADSALQSGSSMLARARELALLGSNGSLGPSAREALAAEVESIRDGLVDIANSSFVGRPIFAGTVASSQAYAPDGTYLGDGGTIERVVGDGVQLRVDLNGPEVFGPPGSSAFDVLTALAADLRSGAADIASTHLPQIDGARDRLLTGLGEIGARSRRLEGIRERATQLELNLTERLSEAESVDMPTTVMELQLQEVAYQAALSATARVIQPSLLDFLR
jgi:flagellar hook-associated protein 3 FlgL